MIESGLEIGLGVIRLTSVAEKRLPNWEIFSEKCKVTWKHFFLLAGLCPQPRSQNSK